MASWGEFASAAQALAAKATELLYQEGVGYGFLATVRWRDGGPRVHPVCPVAGPEQLWVFVVEMSPKYEDLLRDPRYALHSFPLPGGGEELYITGRAYPDEAAGARAAATEASGGLLGHNAFEKLFALDIRHVLHTRWAHWGTARAWPEYTRWQAV